MRQAQREAPHAQAAVDHVAPHRAVVLSILGLPLRTSVSDLVRRCFSQTFETRRRLPYLDDAEQFPQTDIAPENQERTRFSLRVLNGCAQRTKALRFHQSM